MVDGSLAEEIRQALREYREDLKSIAKTQKQIILSQTALLESLFERFTEFRRAYQAKWQEKVQAGGGVVRSR